MKNICIFCGSAKGNNKIYVQAAKELARQLAEQRHRLIYGGASIGIMGELAEEWLAFGSEVVGIMPRDIIRLEVAHNGLSKFIETENMHERKMLMHKMSDLFIALPGGMGTLDELCEEITWAQLAFHQKKIIIANINGYYDHFIAHIHKMHQEGFYADKHLALFVECCSIDEVLSEVNR